MKTIDKNMYPELRNKWFEVADLTDITTKDKLMNWVVSAYKDVFNNSAWEEWVKCASWCWFKTTFEKSPVKCPECNWWIEDFYSDTDVKWFVDNVVDRSSYKQALALVWEDEVVWWFTWGWNTELAELNKEKLGLSDEEYKKLCGELNNIWMNPEAFLYYQSETGITGENRWKWLGKDLISLNQKMLEQNKDKVSQIIQRTSKSSPMYKIREKQWYSQVYDYNDEDWRVLFAKENN